MKMKRNLILLGVVLLLAVGLVIGAPYLKPTAEPTPAPTQEADLEYLTRHAGIEVTELTLENASGTFTLLQKGGVISLKDRTDELDQTEASTVLSSLSAIAVERVIEEKPVDLALYGLAEPQAKATITFEDGDSASLLLGKKAGSGNTYYVIKQPEERVVTAWISVGTAMTTAVESLLPRQAIGIAEAEIQTLTVRRNAQDIYSFTDQDVQGDVNTYKWMVTVPWRRSANVEKLIEVTTAASNLAMVSVVEADAKDLGKYGLDTPSAELIITSAQKTVHLLIGDSGAEREVYAKFADSPKIYTMSVVSLDFMDIDPYTLVDNMMLLVNINRAVAAQVDCLGQKGTLQIEQLPSLDKDGKQRIDGNGNPMLNQSFAVDGKALEEDVGRYYYRTLIGLKTHSAVDASWKPAATPVGTITFTRTSEPKTVSFKAYEFEKDFYAVTLDDISFFRMKKEMLQVVADDMVKLQNGTLELVD